MSHFSKTTSSLGTGCIIWVDCCISKVTSHSMKLGSRPMDFLVASTSRHWSLISCFALPASKPFINFVHLEMARMMFCHVWLWGWWCSCVGIVPCSWIVHCMFLWYDNCARNNAQAMWQCTIHPVNGTPMCIVCMYFRGPGIGNQMVQLESCCSQMGR